MAALLAVAGARPAVGDEPKTARLATQTFDGPVLWVRLAPAPGGAGPRVLVARPGFVEVLDGQLKRQALLKKWGVRLEISADGAWMCAYDPGMKGAPFSAHLLDQSDRETATFSVDFQPLRSSDLPRFWVHALEGPAVVVLLGHRDPGAPSGWASYLGFFDKSGQNTASYSETITYPAYTASGADVFAAATRVSMDPSGAATRASLFSSAGQRTWETVIPGWAPMSIAVSPHGDHTALGLSRGDYAEGTAQWRTVFYDRKGNMKGTEEMAAGDLAFSPDGVRLAGIHDYDLVVFDVSIGRLDWMKTLEIAGAKAPAEAVALANKFMAVITRRAGKNDVGKPATLRSIHLLPYGKEEEPLFRHDFSVTPEGTDLGKPGVVLSADGTLMALWERNRVWTYRIAMQ